MFCGSGSLDTAPTLSKGPGWLLGTQGSYSAEGIPPSEEETRAKCTHYPRDYRGARPRPRGAPPAHERLPSFSRVMLLL